MTQPLRSVLAFAVRWLAIAGCGLGVSTWADELSLAGQWQVTLRDPQAGGTAWQAITLPGTLDDAGIGDPLVLKPELNNRILSRLQRKHSYVGPAWYRRVVRIPDAWAGHAITVELERVLWESRVFVDGREIGRADSLTTPHRHGIAGGLAPGAHEFVLRIDNREQYADVSRHLAIYELPEDQPVAHAYTNHTQVMWNGVLGQMRLVAEPLVGVTRVRVTPRFDPAAAGGGGQGPRLQPSVGIEVTAANRSGASAGAKLQFVLRRRDSLAVVARRDSPVEIPAGGGTVRVEWELPPGVSVAPWDEFSPVVYTLDVAVGDRPETRVVSTDFGFREIGAADGELRLNGHRIFLRGNVDCAAFPLTGHPPADVDSWLKILGEEKRWGLNHVRFHTWCPPEAAFVAADQLGMYLQVELPHWVLQPVKGHDTPSWAFLEAEADRIMAEYGNHPSFVLFSLGNELEGDVPRLNALVRRLRASDPRRLYTTATCMTHPTAERVPQPADQFFVEHRTRAGWIRGERVLNERPNFEADYRAATAIIPIPVLSHEIGQYAVFPDLREIARYTGNLVPLNYVAIRDDLAKKGLLELAPQFTAASGRFAAVLYKEEMERALRTPHFDGFQLLGLQDFPGQGTSPIGLLNVFWESKGVATAGEFRRACAPVVLLARLPQAVYERGDRLVAKMEMANFLRDLPEAEVEWEVRDGDGGVVAEGRFGPTRVLLGNGRAIGTVDVAIPASGEAAQWRLGVRLRGTEFRNDWNVWVYPRGIVRPPADVTLATNLSDALSALSAGRRVVFAPPPNDIKGIPGRFLSLFWNPVMFPKQPGTMGILCDPAHPALRGFPTSFHSDWQWWDPTNRSKSVMLDGLAATPIVRVIDAFNRNHSLANVFEARVGGGRLLFCAIDIVNDLESRPVARQLRASLLRYAASPEFNPAGEITTDALRQQLNPSGKPKP